MQELWHRIWTRPSYGAGFLIISTFVFLFIWRTADPQSFYNKVTGFINDMKVLVEYVMVLAIIIMGIMIMFGWRPFKKPTGGKGH